MRCLTMGPCSEKYLLSRFRCCVDIREGACANLDGVVFCTARLHAVNLSGPLVYVVCHRPECPSAACDYKRLRKAPLEGVYTRGNTEVLGNIITELHCPPWCRVSLVVFYTICSSLGR